MASVNTAFEIWSTSNLPYNQDDTVSLNEKFYLSLENNNSDPPGNSSKWLPFNTFNDMWKYLWSKFRGDGT